MPLITRAKAGYARFRDSHRNVDSKVATPSFSSSSDSKPPPPYTPSAAAAAAPHHSSKTRVLTFSSYPRTPNDPYAVLSCFDTVFLIDDSWSMSGPNWAETSAALSAIVPICTAHDADGVDIHFLNSRTSRCGVKRPADVMELFQSVKPTGSTPTGRRLGALLDSYIDAYRRDRSMKPLNIICITDGEPTDPGLLETTIVKTARELDRLGARERQVGVQFFQVGNDPGATESLEELDNTLVEEKGVRDMVDTISWKEMNGGNGLSGEGVLKACCGAIDRSLDRKRKLN